MKKTLLNAFAILLLSAVGISQAWGQVVYSPTYQGVGNLDFVKFDYHNQDTNPDHGFGYWSSSNPDHIGYTHNGRFFDMLVILPEDGIYAISFLYGVADAWPQGGTYQASIQSGACTFINGSTNPQTVKMKCTGGESCSSNYTGLAIIELRAEGIQYPCSAIVRLTHQNGNMDAKGFKLTKGTEGTPAYQGLGDLDITKFAYAGTGAPTVNFGRWYEKDYISSFSGQNADARNVTFELDLPSSGTYRIKFNTAYALSDQCTYKASTTTSGCSITTDGGEGNVYPSATGGLEKFTQTHWINVTSPAAGHVDVVLTHGSKDTANFKNFELQKQILVDATGGQCIVSSFYSDGAVLGVLPATAVRPGFALKGWYTEAIGGEKVTETTPCATLNTIYAQWEDNSNYKAITSSTADLQWNEDYTFISGLYKTDIEAVWADNGNKVDGHTRAVSAGQTVVLKFPEAYKYVTSTGTTYYDIYAAVTPSENINNAWTANIQSASPRYLKIMPKDAPENFTVELWLQEGSAIADDVEFIAGHCYVAQDEYVSVYGTEPIINSNLAQSRFAYSTTNKGWRATDADVNKPAYYIIGNGYTADHHVRIAYSSNVSGRNCEITMGYLNCTYTFHYPSEPSTAPTRSYRMNQEVKLSQDASADIASRKGWEITEGKVQLQDGTKLTVNDILTDATRDQIKVVDNATLLGYAPYAVTFDPNGTGATVSPTSKQVELGDVYGEMPTPARAGYQFEGWYTDATDGTLVEATTYVKQTTTHTLYAHWIENIVHDGTGMTYAAAQAEVDTKLAAWSEESDIDLTIVRTIYKDGFYNTLCLPFDLTNEQIIAAFGQYKELKKFVSATIQGTDPATRQLVLELEEATSIEAGEAYLISFQQDADLTEVHFTGVTVTKTEPVVAPSQDVVYQGILTPVILTYEDQNLLFVGGNNKLYWPISDGTFTRGFRAYFAVADQVQGVAVRSNSSMMPAAFSMIKRTPTAAQQIISDEAIRKYMDASRIIILNKGVAYDLNGNIIK